MCDLRSGCQLLQTAKWDELLTLALFREREREREGHSKKETCGDDRAAIDVPPRSTTTPK